MSTSAVKETRELAQEAARHGIVYLDAPVARLREAARTHALLEKTRGAGYAKEYYPVMFKLLEAMIETPPGRAS